MAYAARIQPDSADPDDAFLRNVGLSPDLYHLAQQSEALVDLMAHYFDHIETGRATDFSAIAESILHARGEIRELRPMNVSQSQLPSAGAEMDAIMLDTESATNVIMSAAERILELETDDKAAKDAIDDAVMRIFEACSFQDITGQRISKILRLIGQIEHRMGRLATSLGGDQEFEPISAEEQRRRDLILNGPAIGGPETAQADIDSMFSADNTEDSIDAMLFD